MRLSAYESARIYKQKIKAYHDWKLQKKNFQPGQHALLFNSRLGIFPRKLKSKWSGPFVIKDVKPDGVVELIDLTSSEPERSWIVNGQCLKVYNGGHLKRLTNVIYVQDP
ncbi:uncharacterized protein LOC114424012 [Glycine soja]|uniref:uncharacterized protein n=1 Tax=Glycine max TaxID=3847 RepID=UPI0003DE75D8|nr:uncharacterized protein LOC102659687 [Glycine max]XP_028246691.1 uncharacterized protein LOC114424012 [Glycine soja]|eukprot:XP_006586444.1 uncharacterized protein LOC102659687 [Glycine max]